ncbi:LapA family protein [Cellulomonas rhizosphaerae]|uniref:LapA family protein n=1 Tax=Cellulomonas rhizosphaerae TaxID=2293719 RepID=A0A413RHU6_9CELL|nr:LapA family protein [Cellulomonas rhizosphaerae]RHA37786.1 LapA family protein [Cellulomonas rhizosphaerae]
MSTQSPSPSPRPGGTPAEKKPIPWRLYAGLVVVVVALVIILQNTQAATFEVLAWSFETPTWVMLLITLALGVVIGWLLHYRRTSRKRKGK